MAYFGNDYDYDPSDYDCEDDDPFASFRHDDDDEIYDTSIKPLSINQLMEFSYLWDDRRY